MIKSIFKLRDDWTFVEENDDEGVARWSNEYGDILSVNYFSMVPDIAAPIEDIDLIRSFYRNMAEENGIAPIEIEITKLKKLPAVKTIYKIKMETSGFAFIGAITIPFSDRSFVLKIQAIESGITGVRESAVLALEDGIDTDEESGKIVGWEADPYDPDHYSEFMANKADAEKYDRHFPEHPLSRLRANLKLIEDTVEINEKLYDFEPFVFNPNKTL